MRKLRKSMPASHFLSQCLSLFSNNMHARTVIVTLVWLVGAAHVEGSRMMMPSFRSTYECTDDPQHPSRNHCTFTNLVYFRGQLMLVVDNATDNRLPANVPTNEYDLNVLHQAIDYDRVADFILTVTEVQVGVGGCWCLQGLYAAHPTCRTSCVSACPNEGPEYKLWTRRCLSGSLMPLTTGGTGWRKQVRSTKREEQPSHTHSLSDAGAAMVLDAGSLHIQCPRCQKRSAHIPRPEPLWSAVARPMGIGRVARPRWVVWMLGRHAAARNAHRRGHGGRRASAVYFQARSSRARQHHHASIP